MLAARGFWRGRGVVVVLQKLVQKRAVEIALRCDAAVSVVVFFAVGGDGDQLVNHHVAGAGIERDHLFGRCAARQDRDVGDAAYIEGNAGFRRAAEEHVIYQGHERRALSSGCDVAGAEVGDYGDAEALRDY